VFALALHPHSDVGDGSFSAEAMQTMAFDMNKNLPVGAKVRVAEPMEPPDWSTWDDDKGRTSGTVKKRLQGMFFRGDKKVVAEIVYIAKETEREKLRRNGQIKVRLRDPSGAMLTITADPAKLTRA
jgi:hypothetical protein